MHSVIISLYCAAEFCMWLAADTHWSRVFTCTRVYQKTQLLSTTVRLQQPGCCFIAYSDLKKMIDDYTVVCLTLLASGGCNS